MKRWEFKTFRMETSPATGEEQHAEETDLQVDAWLSSLGAQGWEPIAPPMRYYMSKLSVTVTCKREVAKDKGDGK